MRESNPTPSEVLRSADAERPAGQAERIADESEIHSEVQQNPGTMTTEPAPTRTPGMTKFDAVVADLVVETPDTVTAMLDIGQPASYRAGQYVSIDPHQFPSLYSVTSYLEQMKGRAEPPRAYSMSSSPDEPYVAITIKEEVYDGQMAYPPLLSGFLVHQLRAGDRIEVLGFAGAYVLPDKAHVEHILHLCAGSGSVPNVSILKDSLRRHPRLRHTFIYSNKTWRDVIFRHALAELQAAHPDRLRVIHALTREPAPSSDVEDVRSGRVTIELIGGVLEREPDSLIYACGPAVSVWDRRAHAARGTTPAPRFLETVRSYLNELRVPRERIKIEAFG
jgi:3-ketosteroid 9alpha-monooxygenase subunit B